jgi:hypothetical protein
VKHFFSFGIDDPKVRLAVWAGACVASSVLLVFWWPLGSIPFGILFLRASYVAKKVL